MKTAGEDALEAELSTTPYEYVRPIARGGMSSVHLVRHRALGHELVMKLLGERDKAQNEELTRRLLREGRVLRSLENEHILRVVDFGFTQSMRAYLITERLLGKTLKEEVKARGGLPIPEVVSIARQVLAGLEHAHAAGIVHRDLKPENILWLEPDANGERSIKILDFGIVKILDVEVRMKVGDVVPTAPGLVLGTPAYASPEQIAGMPADARADLYGLGGVIFFLLVGRGPFVGTDVFNLLQAHIIERPTPPAQLRADTPPWLDAVVLKALAKDRRDRFANAREMLEAFDLGAATPAQATTVKLEDIETQPIPPQTLRALTMKTTALSAAAEPAVDAPRPKPPPAGRTTLPLPGAYRPTLYQSSPLKETLAKAAEDNPPSLRTASKGAPAPPRHALPPAMVDRAAGSTKATPRRPRVPYPLKLVLWSILVALAVIGLLRIAGLDP